MNRPKLLKAILLISLSLAIIGGIAYRPIVDQVSYTKIANKAGVTPDSVKNAIKVLESSDKKIVPLNADKTILLQKKKDNLYQGKFPYGRLTEFLGHYGWKFEDWMGAGVTYKKNGAYLHVYCGMSGFLSAEYVVYKLEKAP